MEGVGGEKIKLKIKISGEKYEKYRKLREMGFSTREIGDLAVEVLWNALHGDIGRSVQEILLALRVHGYRVPSLYEHIISVMERLEDIERRIARLEVQVREIPRLEGSLAETQELMRGYERELQKLKLTVQHIAQFLGEELKIDSERLLVGERISEIEERLRRLEEGVRGS